MGSRSRLRVTFDTNVLDLACRPERFPKDCRKPLMKKVHAALAVGEIEGFYSVTMLTIEGIMRRNRAEVFADTRMVMQPERRQIIKNADLPAEIREMVGSQDLETILLEYQVDQPERKPLPSEVVARMNAAKAMGFKVLQDVRRIGAFYLKDPTEEYYLEPVKGPDLEAWIARANDIARAIEARGIGFAQVKSLGEGMAASDPEAAWFRCLDRATDIHKRREVERAFNEWADGDSVAAHAAYDLDVFCSDDVGKSNVTKSVLDSHNRAWLTKTYGVRFMTFKDLAANLPQSYDDGC